MTVLFEPASAIAAGLCLAAHLVNDRAITTRHPGTCGWCDYSIDELQQLIDGFNEWAGYQEKTRTYERHEARVFQGLPRSEQRRLVFEAQAFQALAASPVEPPPSIESMQVQPTPPADAAEVTEWVL